MLDPELNHIFLGVQSVASIYANLLFPFNVIELSRLPSLITSFIHG
jgi:hypothetical protein